VWPEEKPGDKYHMLGPKTSNARAGFLPNKNTNEKQWCDVGHDNDNIIDDYIGK
jgi:hypothetical protein